MGLSIQNTSAATTSPPPRAPAARPNSLAFRSATMAFVTVPASVASTFSCHSTFISARPRTLVVRQQAPPSLIRMDANGKPSQAETEEPQTEVIIDENIAGFCSINPRTGKRAELSVREKERVFLDAAQAYFRGDSTLSNEEFDTLKEELTWQGSDVVTLSRDEFMFLDAAKSYEEGNPTMPNEEFDKLKKKLIDAGSIVAIQRGPRCSIRRQITFSDVIPDRKRTFVLYVPAGLLVALLWLSFSFEFTPLHNIDPVLSLIIGSPAIFLLAKLLTSAVVPDPQIMVGDCPSCGRRTHVFFGDVLTNKGFQEYADVKCDKCKAKLKVEKDTNRMILISEG
ncbi:unnamed protein product [Chondrus crispus]|uniref:PGR5-like protein 1A, chloroplastic n=1 Tax=Chondrus crispus TaxID=2769 RepID=R7QP96_CHOCR|nr:unnamed protein product [Chondrus crispus]CDF39306.1 unnamed protein product [Chondrus crispus]|eukprot:XP_005719217.1 unnamed protein product [Chondrus crispus]